MSLVNLANYALTVLNFDATKILIGRENYELSDLQDNVIIIDSTNTAIISSSYAYDGELEAETLTAKMSMSATVSFFGTNA